jgi:glycosyltransferase involved in cell wall biosynthesis
MKISIVIPLLNEEESLLALYQAINDVMEKNSYNKEIIFIDDGSTDGSVKIIKSIISTDNSVKLIVFRRNFGKAAALQAGFRLCEGDYVITMDADLQDDPEEIPRFIDKLNEGYDLVSGWKYNRHDPLEKTLPSKLFNKVTAFFSGVKLHDFNCGFKAYRKAVVESLDIYGELHRYIPVLASRYGYNICEIVVNHKPRIFGKSKYGLERYLRGLFDSLSVSFVAKYHDKPMYVFGRIGLLLSISGFAICTYLTIEKFLGAPLASRPLLLLGILLIVLGVQFFSSGLIANLIVDGNFRRNYKENHIKEIIDKGRGTNCDMIHKELL